MHFPVDKPLVGQEAVHPWWWHVALPAISALLLGLAFPMPGWSVLAYVAIVPVMLLAAVSARPGLLLATTYLAGVAWWLVMIRWMFPVTGAGTVALCLFLAAYWPMGVFLARWCRRGWSLPMAVAAPMAWTAAEFIRGNFAAGGFGWYLLSHSQAAYTPAQGTPIVAQCADLLGEWTVSLVVACISGAFVDLLVMPWRKADAGGRGRLSWKPIASLGGAVLVLAAALGYGYARVNALQNEEHTPRTVKVCVIQTNTPQSNRNHPTAKQMTDDWNTLLALTREAAEADRPGLIIWPESVAPVKINRDSQAVYLKAGFEEGVQFYTDLLRLVDEIDTPILVGAPRGLDWGPTPSGRVVAHREYNAAFLFAPGRGQVGDSYSKVHRVPFGEYIPWVEDIPWAKQKFFDWFSPYDHDYTVRKGEALTVFEPPGIDIRVVTPICFEDTVARMVRRLVYQDGQRRADLIANMTNDGWFAGTDQPWQHLQVATLRSIEMRVPTARAVNTGVSGFIDVTGRIVKLAEEDGRSTDVLTFASWEVPMAENVTLFGRVGQWPILILSIGMVAFGFAGAMRLRNQRKHAALAEGERRGSNAEKGGGKTEKRKRGRK